MYIVASFHPVQPGTGTVTNTNGTFPNTLPGGIGTYVIRNNTYLKMSFSLNNLAGLAQIIAAGEVKKIKMNPSIQKIYWSFDLTEAGNSPTTARTSAANEVIVEGYVPAEPIPDLTTFVPRVNPVSHPLIAALNAQGAAEFIFVTSQGTLPSTSAQTTSLIGVKILSGIWLTKLVVTFGIPTSTVAIDATLTDHVNATELMRWHINTGTTIPYRIEENFYPYMPVEFLSTAVPPTGGWDFNTPATVGGPGYSVVMHGINM